MRKIMLVSLVVFCVVVAGSVGITWFLQAATARKNIESAVGAINEKQTYITYDAIETSGFPSSVTVTIVKPRFSGRMDQLISELRKDEHATPMPEWHEDIALDGTIVLGINAMSDHYTLAVRGNWTQHGKIGERAIDTASSSPGDLTCMLELGHSD